MKTVRHYYYRQTRWLTLTDWMGGLRQSGQIEWESELEKKLSQEKNQGNIVSLTSKGMWGNSNVIIREIFQILSQWGCQTGRQTPLRGRGQTPGPRWPRHRPRGRHPWHQEQVQEQVQHHEQVQDILLEKRKKYRRLVAENNQASLNIFCSTRFCLLETPILWSSPSCC